MTVLTSLGQPVDLNGPVFRKPWEASAFAIVVKLSEAGHFTWSEWADCLSQEIRLAEAAHQGGSQSHGENHDHHHDDGSEYYHQWFAALEKMLAAKNILGSDVVDVRHKYLKENPIPHDQVARREPVCVA